MIVENTSRWSQEDFEELIKEAVRQVKRRDCYRLDGDGTVICILSHWTGKELTIKAGPVYEETKVFEVKIPRPARFKKHVVEQLADLADGTAEDLPHEWMPRLGAAVIALILGHEKDTRRGMDDTEAPYDGAWAANMRLRAIPKRACHTSYRKARHVMVAHQTIHELHESFAKQLSELEADLVGKQDALTKARKKEAT